MPELQILSNWWYIFGLPFIILTLVLVFVLFQSSSKKRAIAELTGQTTTSQKSTSRTSWINWKLIFAVVVVGILAYLYFFTGVSGDVAGWFASFGELFRNASELETQEVHLIVMVFSMILVGFGLLLILVTRDTRALSDALPWIIGLILVLVVLTKFF